MGRELPPLCQVETRRLLWLMGISFALIVTFQYLELPYSISSLFSANKIPVSSRNGTSETGPPLAKLTPFVDTTGNSGVNGTDNGIPGEKLGNLDAKSTVNVPDVYGSTTYDAMAPIFSLKKDTLGNESKSESGENDSGSVAPSFSQRSNTLGNKSDSGEDGSFGEVEVDRIFENSMNPNASFGSPSPAISPTSTIADVPVASISLNPYPGKENVSVPSSHGDGNDQEPQKNSTKSSSGVSPVALVPAEKEKQDLTESAVISISEMYDRLSQSHSSRRSKKPKWPSEPDRELLRAKSAIEAVPVNEKDPLLYPPLYRNVSMFTRSYELMERMLKVYIYKEGKKPIMHTYVLKGIYASEGWFMKLLESNKKFVTRDSKKAHLFYLPFSSRMLEETLYVKDSHSHRNLIQYLKDYIDFISMKYPFWNRTSGADHFLVACHDWAPSETRKYMANCIRALCNSDVKEGFIFGKDASLPETYVRNPQKPLHDLGGKSISRRPILAFFAGRPEHGYLRPILLSYWGDNKDPDMKIFGKLPRSKGNRNYIQYMKTSKFCICAKGYEVNSPRVVEAIFYECVPVIISDNFVPPFFEVLNWESFAVFVLEKDIPNLKTILTSISERRYKQLQARVKKVQKHFLWHSNPEKYDMFHMILHSVWFNRVFQLPVQENSV